MNWSGHCEKLIKTIEMDLSFAIFGVQNQKISNP